MVDREAGALAAQGSGGHIGSALTFTERVLDRVCHALMVVVGFCLLLMVFNVVADVASKYLLNSPIYGTSEMVGNYYMIAIVFLSVPLVELRNQQIYVDLFFRALNRRLQRRALALVFALQCAFHAFLGLESFHEAIAATAKREIVEGFVAMSIWPARYLLVLGFGLGFVASLVRLFQVLTNHPAIESYFINTPALGGSERHGSS